MEPSFSVFIRCPFPREDFIDPPMVEWNAQKERALWKVLNKASRGNELDWHELADKFEVPLPFLLQQSAWLYEHQLSQVRAQMRKVGNPTINVPISNPSLRPGSGAGMNSGTIIGSQSMRRTGSGGQTAGPIIPYSDTEVLLVADEFVGATTSTIRPREGLMVEQKGAVGGDGSASAHPAGPSATPMSRTSSASTTHYRPSVGYSQPQSSPKPKRASLASRRPSHGMETATATASRVRHSPISDITPPPPPPSSSSSSSSSSPSSSSDSEPASMLRSQALRRPTSSHPSRRRSSATVRAAGTPYLHESSSDSLENDSPAFLPFSNTPTQDTTTPVNTRPSPARHSSSTNSRRPLPQQSTASSPAAPRIASDTTNLASNSRQSAPEPSPSTTGTGQLSPPRKGTSGSEGASSKKSSSMGSSFSDLDDIEVEIPTRPDASVTQSALEEALLSGANTGSTLSAAEGVATDTTTTGSSTGSGVTTAAGVARRMSTIGKALTSRYLP